MGRPNILFVMSDDHAAHAISAYGSVVNRTPQLDRIAAGGMRFDNCFCTNSICAPSRASILTGTYNHVNGVMAMACPFDAGQPSFPPLLQQAGYQTALFGKWHLGHGPEHDPQGFDTWQVLPGQGDYHDPVMLTAQGERRLSGYVTDIITDLSLDWLRDRDPDRPFCLLVHHKAPHREWEPAPRHADLFREQDIPEPATLRDDYATRSDASRAARMRVAEHLKPKDLKEEVPEGLDADAELSWRYQRYIGDYLRCVAAVDEGVGRILDYLDAENLADDTVVIYTSDQGFFLGDHGWYDKRFIYEQSLRMPLLVRYPREIKPGAHNDDLVTNVDFAQTILDWAGMAAPDRMQGFSLRPLTRGEPPGAQRSAVYYRYWQHDDPEHGVWAHYGIRTRRHKLVYFYNDGLGLPGTSGRSFQTAWELYDLVDDPDELHNLWDDPDHAGIQEELVAELAHQQKLVGDLPHHPPAG